MFYRTRSQTSERAMIGRLMLKLFKGNDEADSVSVDKKKCWRLALTAFLRAKSRCWNKQEATGPLLF